MPSKLIVASGNDHWGRRAVKMLLITSLLLLLVASTSAVADNFTFDITQTSISTYAGPFVKVSISLTDSHTATITFTGLTTDNTYLMLDSTAAGVNVNATSFGVTNITSTHLDGFRDPRSLTPVTTGQTVNGWGTFNLVIDTNSGWGSAMDSLTFTLTNTSGTWVSAADVLSANAGGYFAAAHVGPCVLGSTCSAGSLTETYVAGAPVIPEVTSLILFGSGLIVVGGIIRRKIMTRA